MDDVQSVINRIEDKIIDDRRDFHRYAEIGWTEFRTASLVAQRLTELGYRVQLGRDVVRDDARMGLPDGLELERHWQRAAAQGAIPAFLEAMRGAFTGVVGVLEQGPGPTVGIRFDMDALEGTESESTDHTPAREGFLSVNAGAVHACGHDGHTAVGLGAAEVLSTLRPRFAGTVKLIFQPAEEGVRGARAMVAAGVVDDVEYLLAHHLFSGWALGEVVAGLGGYMATEKFDAIFHGVPAHAGASPQDGRNALLAAATAILNLYAIARHGEGATRINVGRVTAGSGRNIIPATAHLAVETRGATSALSDYVHRSALAVLDGAAAMHGCRLEVCPMGAARSGESDPELASRVEKVAQGIAGFTVLPPLRSGGSEDFTYMMERVQQRGGQASFIGVGADLQGISRTATHGREAVLKAHTPTFDFDERGLALAVRVLSAVVLDLLPGEGSR